MNNAAIVPLWVALIALIGSLLSPIVQHLLSRNKVTKVDAAEKFIHLAEGVADDMEVLKKRHKNLKVLVRELLRQYDENAIDPELIELLREQV